jgi:hypothetical protein
MNTRRSIRLNWWIEKPAQEPTRVESMWARQWASPPSEGFVLQCSVLTAALLVAFGISLGLLGGW